VYYLGENGEVLEEVSYSEEDGHVSFEASDFSQYAVAYEEGTYANKDGSEDKNAAAPADDSADSGEKGTAPANDVAGQEDDTASGEQTSDEQVSGEKAEELPNTGIAQNSLIYTVAALLGALGLGSVIASRRRKN